MEACLVQGSESWKSLRKNMIGCSDLPVLMGVSPYKTIYELWSEKHGLSQPKVNAAMKRGTDLEGEAREAYETEVGFSVEPKVIFHPEYQWLLASLDGLSADGSAAVEIKNCSREDHELAKKGMIPEKYIPQVQGQLSCLGLQRMHYWSFCQGEGILVEVVRDDKYIKQLYEVASNFFENHIEGLQEPPLTAKDYVRVETPSRRGVAEQLLQVQKQLKELKETEEALRRSLIEDYGAYNSIGCGIKMTKSLSRGAVDFSAIPELKDVDLEQYRKAPIVKWRISPFSDKDKV
mgnify:FL=1